MNENIYDAWDNGDRHEIRQQLAKRKVANDDDDTQVYRSELEAAVKAEREACAKLCDVIDDGREDLSAKCAAAIRARGEQK